MKGKITALLICVAMLVIFVSCAKSEDAADDYIPYTDISENYLLENAKADGLVVFEDSDITSGQAVWDEFTGNAQDGTPCAVRLAYYYTLGDPSGYAPEYYEEIKDDYPQLFIHDLSFDGEKYLLSFTEEGKDYSFEYKYLKRFDEKPESASARYTDCTRYVLVNDDGVTWEQIWHGLVSSQYGDYIDHYTVYSDYTYKTT